MIPLTPTDLQTAPVKPYDDASDEVALARYMKVLGEPHRMRIFRMLMGAEQCVCDLEERLVLGSSLLAHHLKVLREAGLIQVRRGIQDGRWLYYSIDPVSFDQLRGLLSSLFQYKELPSDAQCGANCRCG
jgi:ArsR family transcriptional regulator